MEGSGLSKEFMKFVKDPALVANLKRIWTWFGSLLRNHTICKVFAITVKNRKPYKLFGFLSKVIVLARLRSDTNLLPLVGLLQPILILAVI